MIMFGWMVHTNWYGPAVRAGASNVRVSTPGNVSDVISADPLWSRISTSWGTWASLFTNSSVNGAPAGTVRSACSNWIPCAVIVTVSPAGPDAGALAGADGGALAGALGGADGTSLGTTEGSALGGPDGAPDGAPLAATSVGGGA